MNRFLITAVLLLPVVAGYSQASLGDVSSSKHPKRSEVAESAAMFQDLVLPPGTHRVAIMEMTTPPRLQELSFKLKSAFQKHADWLPEYVRANAKPGVPLPYHPNMGVSREEYQEFISLSDTLALAPGATAELTLRKLDGAQYALDGGSALPELTGVIIDLDKQQVKTSFGTASTVSKVEANKDQSATGPWSGASWKHESIDETSLSGTIVRFSLGRLQKDGRGILTFSAKRASDGNLEERVDRVLTYTLPSN